jgi:DNA replication protein DnaC
MQHIGEAMNKAKIHNPPLIRQDNCEKHGAFATKCYLGDIWTKCQTCADEARAAEEQAEKAKADAEALQRWRMRVNNAGIPPRFQDRRFKNFEATTPEQKNVLDIARAYAADWEAVRDTGRCMVLMGAPGTGKTHLACAIGTHVMHKHNASVLFRTVYQAVRSVRDTWVKGTEKSESDAIAELTSPQLLILDEVGVQSGSDWEKTVLFDILNERYQQRKPTILLTNLVDDALPEFLGERVVDRLREDGGQVVAFTWKSHRGSQQQ